MQDSNLGFLLELSLVDSDLAVSEIVHLRAARAALRLRILAVPACLVRERIPRLCHVEQMVARPLIQRADSINIVVGERDS